MFVPLILPGKSVNFGASKDQAIAVFGEADEQQELHDDVLSGSLALHYREKELSLFFTLDEDPRFTAAELRNPETLLFGTPLLALDEKGLTTLMKENGFVLSETEKHPWGEKRLTFDAAGMDCYFENRRMTSVHVSLPDPDPMTYQT
jgi:hypothetical protein